MRNGGRGNAPRPSSVRGEPEGEQETAIAAPISLNAEEKEAFSQLSPEAQAFVTSLETRRNADVTKVTTKAADAQRAAEAQAAQQAIQAKQEYARQLEGFMANFAPQMPDPSLAQSNPAAYVAASVRTILFRSSVGVMHAD